MSFPLPPESEPSSPRARGPLRIPSIPTLTLCVTALVLAAELTAGTICWGSTGMVSHRSSCGATGSCDGMRMQLGVFRTGFTPTADNVPEWHENWLALSEAVYDPDERRFAGVADDAAPLPDGFNPQAYVWTFNGTDLTRGPEWMLLAHPSWRWTGAGAGLAPARTWIADDAVLAILGSVETGGSLIASSLVRSEVIPSCTWLADFFPGQPAMADPDADPDGDGLCNRLEYFLGTDPCKGSSLARPALVAGTDTVRLSLRRNPHAVSTFVLETSNDLVHWKPRAAEVVADHPDRFEVRTTKSTDGKPLFYRFQIRSAESP